MKQLWKPKYIRFIIFSFIVMVGLFIGSFYSVSFGESWIASVNSGELLGLIPNKTQWLTINGHLNAVSLVDGKISVVEWKEDAQNWEEIQRFGPTDILFTTFQLVDINNDDMAEIIAGTIEPGFIYIYKYNEGKWDVFNYGKYVWSPITYIAVGNFSGEAGNDILVQNQEGSLYLLKMSDSSLDLVWKSPTHWRSISSAFIIDLDSDHKDEIMVVYKTGGIAILKMENNSIVSGWENYPWGKVLAVTSGDWDDDQKPEIMLSTSQKVIYFLGWSEEKGYQFEDQLSQLNFTIEKLSYYKKDGLNQLIATDTAGKFHRFEYDLKNRIWIEELICTTGRIAQIISADHSNILLWGLNRKMITVNTYPVKEIKLKYLTTTYEITPAVTINNEVYYVSPKALQIIPDLHLTYKNDESGFTITQGDKTIEFSESEKEKNLIMEVNGKEMSLVEQPLIIDGDLQLSLQSYQTLFNLNLQFDFANKNIEITNGVQLKQSNI